MSLVLRLMHEQRSREAKKAEATLVPTQLAIRSSLSQEMKLQLLSIGILEMGLGKLGGDSNRKEGRKRDLGGFGRVVGGGWGS